jgi:hypothetical protein
MWAWNEYVNGWTFRIEVDWPDEEDPEARKPLSWIVFRETKNGNHY